MRASLLFWIGLVMISGSILVGLSLGCAGTHVFTPFGCQ